MYVTQMRLNEITANKIKIIAKKNKRSMNNMIEFLIERYITDYERINGEILEEFKDIDV